MTPLQFLFDQNLSHRLVGLLSDAFPGSAHVRGMRLSRADDERVWQAAIAGGYVLVSKDAEFHQRSALEGYPPKVVWIRLGNRPTAAVESVLRARQGEIATFDADPDAALLILD